MDQLSALERALFQIFTEHGPLTTGEAAQIFRARDPGTTQTRNEITKAVSELRGAGLLRSIGSKAGGFSRQRETVLVASENAPVVKIEREDADASEQFGFGFSFTGVHA